MKMYDFRQCTCKLDRTTCEELYTIDCADCKTFKEYQKRIKWIKIKNIGAKVIGEDNDEIKETEVEEADDNDN